MILETERQILRRLVPDDAQALLDLNADPEVTRYTFDPERRTSVEQERAFLEKYQEVYRVDGFARMAAIERATGAFLGWCGLRKLADGEIDLGYRYVRAAWGRGFATEASRVCLAYGFDELGLERIVADASIHNAASIRVLEKVGMRFERDIAIAGHPCVRYAIAKSDWRCG